MAWPLGRPRPLGQGPSALQHTLYMRCTCCFSVGPLCLALEALRNLNPSVIYKRHPHPHKLPALAKAGNLTPRLCTAFFSRTTCPWPPGPRPPLDQVFSGPSCSIGSMEPPLCGPLAGNQFLSSLFHATFSDGQILHFNKIPKAGSFFRGLCPAGSHTRDI